MLSKRSNRILAVAGLAAWACALPEQSAPPDGGAPTGGTGNTSTGGSTTGGSTTGGSTTGGSTTGGSTTGGSTTGGSTTGGSTTGGTAPGGAGSGTGGSAGSATGGTMSGAGGAGAGGAGAGGSAGSTAGMGGTMGGAGAGGKGGTAGTGGSAGGSVLVHRYSFGETGMTATDSIGTAHGTITGGTQSGGAVTLSGTEQYVTLPNTLLSGLTAATFEAWASWTGNAAWHRLFDFGNNAEDEGDQGSFAGNAAAQYIFFTPRATAGGSSPNCNGVADMPRLAITGAGPSSESCGLGLAPFPSGLTHVAVTIDASNMALYVQGAPVGSPVTPAVSLSGISYMHNWLGRSQFSGDSEFAGTISEFRVYGTARTAAQIQASYTAGEAMAPSQ